MTACPHCGGQVQDAAVFCKHCRRDILSATAAKTPTATKTTMSTGAKFGLAIVTFVVLAIVGVSLNGGFETYPGERAAQAKLKALGVSDRAGSSEDLELVSSRNVSEYGYQIVQGEVKNVSGRKIANLEVVVSWYDRDDQLVKTDDSLIEFNPILDGQTSPFKSMTTSNPAIRSYRIAFKVLGGGTVTHIERGHQTMAGPR